MSNPELWLEFIVLFVLLPLIYRFWPRLIPALPALWVAALYCLWQLRRDPTFSRALLWNQAALPARLPGILGLFALGAVLIGIGVRVSAPKLLFRYVRLHPRLWAVLMVVYPVLSVYPQGMIYRSFLVHRYTALFGTGWELIVVSAAAFAFMHLIFRNRLAVALTFVGGLLFAWRYQVTGSLLTSSIEHALYGCWLFTVGLGDYFYHGTAFGSTNLAAVKVVRRRHLEQEAT
jgi:membrane protease YdiL (CAAX protease family)